MSTSPIPSGAAADTGAISERLKSEFGLEAAMSPEIVDVLRRLDEAETRRALCDPQNARQTE